MVFETIRSLLAQQLGYNETSITLRSSLWEDLEAELMDLEEVMLLLEQEFAIEWTEDDLTKLETVSDLTVFVENQI